MFKETADTFIAEQISQMDKADKKQLIRFIEMQAAYKRARRMRGSVKKNSLKASEIVAIVKKVRSNNAAKKK